MSNNNQSSNMFIKFIAVFCVLMFFGLLMSSGSEKNHKENYAEKLTYVEYIIRRNLKDPDSYKRLNYDIKYNGDEISSITVEYSGTNSFGGRVRETYTHRF